MTHTSPTNPSILIVDDEERVLTMLVRAFRHHDYTILTATNGRDGLELFMKHRRAIKLVISDVLMPVCGGPEMLRQIHKSDPYMPAILISAHFDTITLEGNLSIPLLRKPFRVNELLQEVQDQLAKADHL
jgi:DNA-binding NtrC family response regulator